jgi:hypothetical protein
MAAIIWQYQAPGRKPTPFTRCWEGTACEEIRQGFGVSEGQGAGADREKARKHRLPMHQLMGHNNEEVGMGFLCLGRHSSSRLRAESRYLLEGAKMNAPHIIDPKTMAQRILFDSLVAACRGHGTARP